MLPQILILLGTCALASPGLATVRQVESRRGTSQPAVHQSERLAEVASLGRKGAPAAELLRAKPGVVCTLRVQRADPRVDPGMSRSLGRVVDPEMVVRSPCAE